MQVERLREVRALVGFTRLDAPDPEIPSSSRARRCPGAIRTGYRPARCAARASSCACRTICCRLGDAGRESTAMEAHTRGVRPVPREPVLRPDHRPASTTMTHWPGARYIALHTLSHLLIRTIALECGYSSASLAERIYAGTDDDPRGGILIYTAVPDAEGTLGGLVSLAEPRRADPDHAPRAGRRPTLLVRSAVRRAAAARTRPTSCTARRATSACSSRRPPASAATGSWTGGSSSRCDGDADLALFSELP